MLDNEVLIEKEDKQRLLELLYEASDILRKYPIEIYTGVHIVTAMCRAKEHVADALCWCSHLYMKE